MSIRQLFSNERPIDREIEKVIRIEATEEGRVGREVAEYEVTDGVESNFRRFLEAFDAGLRQGEESEMGVWVSGFYGSGKSSFTKYLGFALDPGVVVSGRPFRDLLRDRIPSSEVKALLGRVATEHSVAVVTLDLGEQMLAESIGAPISTVLYWRVLKWAGYSHIKELANLELSLEREGKRQAFEERVQALASVPWKDIHNDAMLGKTFASQALHEMDPKGFPTVDTFVALKYSEANDVSDQARTMVDLVRRKSGSTAILFVVDEAGQYVAPSAERILNLDGLSKALKGVGQGKVWMIATGQQTLSEIFTKAAYNSPELYKLRDRFPLSIEFSPSDIKEITYRRLLTKSADGEKELRTLFSAQGDSLRTYTRIEGSRLIDSDLDADRFVRFYPFLPQHFSILLELTRALARSTGGIGLRSAIRVIQDILVDKSRVLAPGSTLLVDQGVGHLATVDVFYDTLRTDLNKVFPHAVEGVERVETIFPGNALALRVAKAVAVLQPIEGLPRTPENLAALLFDQVGGSSILDAVRVALKDIEDSRECNLIDDPAAGGYLFVSNAVRDFKNRRNELVPDPQDMNNVRRSILSEGVSDAADLFVIQPQGRLGRFKTVPARVRLGNLTLHNASSTLDLTIEFVSPERLVARRDELMNETRNRADLAGTVLWLAPLDPSVDQQIVEVVRSLKAASADQERAEPELVQFARTERTRAAKARQIVARSYDAALMSGYLIFRGDPTPALEEGASVADAATKALGGAATSIFDKYTLADVKPETELAGRFLKAENLRNVTSDLDPLKFVVHQGGKSSMDANNSVLAEALRAFSERIAGSGRLTGGDVQALFEREPYGWGKDVVRYVFAGLLLAGAIKAYGPAEKDPVIGRGPTTNEIFKGNDSFKRAAFALRAEDEKPKPEVLFRAVMSLERIVGDGQQIMPLEDALAKAVQEVVPDVKESLDPLVERLKYLQLPGQHRMAKVSADLAAVLRGDGSNAAFVLGKVDSDLPSNIEWARRIVKALDEGGEDAIRDARKLVEGISSLKGIIDLEDPIEASANALRTVADVLASETFAERLADLRVASQTVSSSLSSFYDDQRERLGKELNAARRQVEAAEGWERLADEDREEMLRPFEADLPDLDGRDVLNAIRDAEFRIVGVASKRDTALREVERRQPPALVVDPVAETETIGTKVVEVRLADLVGTMEIGSVAELRAFMASLETALGQRLRNGGRIRIETGDMVRR